MQAVCPSCCQWVVPFCFWLPCCSSFLCRTCRGYSTTVCDVMLHSITAVVVVVICCCFRYRPSSWTCCSQRIWYWSWSASWGDLLNSLALLAALLNVMLYQGASYSSCSFLSADNSPQCLQCVDTVGWVAGRASILKKLSDEVLVWLSVCSEVQMIYIWSSWCYCHPIISCCSKIQNSLPFWCWPTQVVLEKRPLNGCSSSSG